MLVCAVMAPRDDENEGPLFDEPSGAEALAGTRGEDIKRSFVAPVVEHSDQYLRTLFLLLLAATFFEGYDGSILSLVLPAIRDTFNVPESRLGVSRALIELGLAGAFFFARAGDRWGRRRLLLWSVAGYTLMTALTALSRDIWTFTAFQCLSRVFLGAEYAVALTMIVEEFPKERRSRVLGVFLMCSAIGAIVVVLLALGGLDNTALGWRGLYLVGVIPLIFLAFFRRRLKETKRFQAHAEAVTAGGGSLRVNFFEPWRAPYRRTLVLVGLVHLFRSLPLFGATSWYFYFAQREGRLGETTSQLIFLVAYGAGTIGYWACGRLMERYGTRQTAILYGSIAAVSAAALFQANGPIAIGLFLVVAVFFGLGMAPVTGAISTELFPTYIRNQSAAWARNIFEISGFILGPLLVGVLGDHYTGALGSIGDTVTVLVFLFVPAVWLVWRHLPETKGRELEEIESELGITADTRDRYPDVSARKAVMVMVAAGAVIAVILAAGVPLLGRITRHPEGAAERYLQAISSGDRKEVAQFGSLKLARELFGTKAAHFDTIAVGRDQRLGSLSRIPVSVSVNGKTGSGLLLVSEQGRGHPADLKVVGYTPSSVSLPIKDGAVIAGAPRVAWPVTAVVIVLLTLLAEVLLRSLRRD